MVFDGELNITGMPSPERLIFEQVIFAHILSRRDLDLFDLLTSTSNQFIYVPDRTQVINLVKFVQAV